MVKIGYRCWKEDSCDLTGKLIKRMEPRLKIDNIWYSSDGEITRTKHTSVGIRKSELNKLENKLRSDNNSKNDNGDFYTCGHNREKITIKTKHYENMTNIKNIKLCDNCVKEVLSMIEKIQNEDYVKFHTEKGLSVSKVGYDEHNLIEKSSDDLYSVKLGTDSKKRLCIRLVNLIHLYDALDNNIQGYKGINIKLSDKPLFTNDKYKKRECVCCGNLVNYLDRDETYNYIFIHKSCVDTFKSAILDLIENNHSLITSTILQDH
jgi:hypothetical protein